MSSVERRSLRRGLSASSTHRRSPSFALCHGCSTQSGPGVCPQSCTELRAFRRSTIVTRWATSQPSGTGCVAARASALSRSTFLSQTPSTDLTGEADMRRCVKVICLQHTCEFQRTMCRSERLTRDCEVAVVPSLRSCFCTRTLFSLPPSQSVSPCSAVRAWMSFRCYRMSAASPAHVSHAPSCVTTQFSQHSGSPRWAVRSTSLASSGRRGATQTQSIHMRLTSPCPRRDRAANTGGWTCPARCMHSNLRKPCRLRRSAPIRPGLLPPSRPDSGFFSGTSLVCTKETLLSER